MAYSVKSLAFRERESVKRRLEQWDISESPIVLFVGGEKMESDSLLRTDKELAELYQRHADLVYRVKTFSSN
ncbi:hypothetical protein ACFPPD_26595 [Cohnella suwonensis]|uniref:Uncharacterized protein n=1 Tax=Cohnella suwonensis TaxID=696072 RepID=A0ABW0M291_9BACL